MTLSIHDGTQFRTITSVWLHDGTQFRQLSGAWIHDGAQFRQVYSNTSPTWYLRPDADIGGNPGWSASSGSALWGVLDEVTPSTTDYAYTTTYNRSLTVGLSNPVGTPTGTGIVLKVGWQITAVGAADVTSDDQKAEVLQGTTVLQTFNAVGSETANSVTASISDYTALRVRVTPDSGLTDDRFDVYWIELYVPQS